VHPGSKVFGIRLFISDDRHVLLLERHQGLGQLKLASSRLLFLKQMLAVDQSRNDQPQLRSIRLIQAIDQIGEVQQTSPKNDIRVQRQSCAFSAKSPEFVVGHEGSS